MHWQPNEQRVGGHEALLGCRGEALHSHPARSIALGRKYAGCASCWLTCKDHTGLGWSGKCMNDT